MLPKPYSADWRRGGPTAVDGVSPDVNRGETFGLVGESGSGEAAAPRPITRPIEPMEGEIPLGGARRARLGAMGGEARRRLRCGQGARPV